MNSLTNLCYFSALFLSFLLFLSHAAINPAPFDPPVNYHTIQQCLLRRSVPFRLLLSPSSTNFTAALVSPARNPRVLHEADKPFLILTAIQESHATAAVLCSRELGLRLVSRSGGHDYEGLSYASKLGPFLILDLQLLRSVAVDAESGTAWVEAGAVLGELYYAIAAKSRTLAFPAGFCSTVGVGGHFSGGGIGTIMRAHGLAVDHIVDIRVVDADGRILDRGSMGEDLFWALRGGGGASYGVVLAYKIRLVQVPPKVTVFSKTQTLADGATQALAKWQQIAYRTDRRLYISATVQVSNQPNSTIQATFNSLFLGERAELLPLLKQSIPELGLQANDCKEMTWVESQLVFSFYPLVNLSGGPLTLLLNRNTAGRVMSFKVKSDIVTTPIKQQNWEKIWRFLLKAQSQLSLLIEPFGGRMNEIQETATPFPHRNGSKFVIQHIAAWPEAGEKVADKHMDGIWKFYNFMAPFVSKNPRGAYLNFRDLDLGKNSGGDASYEKDSAWGRSYFKANFDRLVYVKTKVDPKNFFRNEQSIPTSF
ncbi:hypothetical protein HPP92_015704 [Vanilla planifolia]|uniref:FAD-binding PCMH-type domain-containing protein n=1 Tax=Vanilla planifolia TaxID=51239 RepID=A0A835URE3_VANPL|nr:hypothetical protein HPP92_015704 [Vanilla planifolia]